MPFIQAPQCWQIVWRRTRYRRIVYFFLMILAWSVIVPPVYISFLNQGGKDDTIERKQTSSSEDYIDVTLVAQSANLIHRKLSLYAELNPQGKYRQGYSELTTNVTGYFGEKNVAFKKGKRMQSFDLTVPMRGYPRLYPFDDYETIFEIYLKEGDNKLDDEVSVPIRLTVFGSIQSFKFETQLQVSPDGDHSVAISINAVRTKITLFFTLFIMLVMWSLAFTMSTLAYQIGISRRNVSPALLNVGISMMFALPALRNSQPGVPALGCASDALSFLW